VGWGGADDDEIESSSEAKPKSWKSLACSSEAVLSMAFVDGSWRKNVSIVSVERFELCFCNSIGVGSQRSCGLATWEGGS
jgi:hypothetical protein